MIWIPDKCYALSGMTNAGMLSIVIPGGEHTQPTGIQVKKWLLIWTPDNNYTVSGMTNVGILSIVIPGGEHTQPTGIQIEKLLYDLDSG